MNVTGVSCPCYQELYQLAHKSCAFSLSSCTNRVRSAPVLRTSMRYFCTPKGCVCVYVHTHADYKSPSRAPLIIWWILQLMPALSTIMITLKFPATRLREGGETFQSSCFGNKCSFLLVFPVPPGDVFRLSPPPNSTIKLLFFHFFFQFWWLTELTPSAI